MATKTEGATRSSHVTGAAAAAPTEPVIATRAPLTPEEMAAGSIGAQIILDYNSAGSLGARGGAGVTFEENLAARDAHLIALGLDPAAPSGPPSGDQVTRDTGGVKGRATKISSLAAGLLAAAGTAPPAGNGATAPVNRDVPHVSQAGAELLCTMGNWNGEPTSYAYQWKFDGADGPGDGATCPVTAAEVGKTATCVVTATNAHGSTAAPPSNEVTIADPATAGGQSRSKR
jgi:hypothetical protein